MWYLLTLFAARLVFNWIAHRKWYFLLFVFGIVPWVVRVVDAEVPLYVSNISMAVLFMGLGYLLKPHLGKKWIGMVAAAVYLLCIVFLPTYVDMRYNTLLYGHYYLWYVIALSGIVTINALFGLVQYRMPVLAYVGKNSMAFFCLHWILFTICRIVFLLAGWNYLGYAFVATALAACMLLIPFCNELLKRHRLAWLLGGNDRNVKETA